MSVALDIQHAMRMCHVISSSVVCLAAQYSSTLSHKWHDFRKKKIVENSLCSLILSKILSETFLVARSERDIIDIHRYSCKLAGILLRF